MRRHAVLNSRTQSSATGLACRGMRLYGCSAGSPPTGCSNYSRQWCRRCGGRTSSRSRRSRQRADQQTRVPSLRNPQERPMPADTAVNCPEGVVVEPV